jgi:hypothetical protein
VASGTGLADAAPAQTGRLMSRAQMFEAKAEAAERLAREVPMFRQIYDELAVVWHRLARQALAFDPPAG